jgi:hypothetical protein
VSFVFLVFAGVAVWQRDWPLVWLLLGVVVVFVLAGFGCLKLGQKMVSHE